MSRVLVADFDTETLEYFRTISSGAPCYLYPSPRVFLSSPVSEEIEDEADGQMIDLIFKSARSVFNPNTDITELDVFLSLTVAREDLAFFPKKVDERFSPYFCWMQDPLQNQATRRFYVSLINTLRLDMRPLRARVCSVPEDAPIARVFNPYVLDTEANLFLR